MVKQNQEEKDANKKVYQEYSRRQYTEYKLRFPKMKESALVSKIVKEWADLTDLQKHQLAKKYQQHHQISSDSSMEAIKSEENGQEISENQKKKTNKKAKKEIKKEEFESPAKKNKSEKKQRVGTTTEKVEVMEPEKSESEVEIRIRKTKAIKKSKKSYNGEYVTFFKFYYEKLHAEHSKWLPHQISQIVGMLWKKRMTTQSKMSKKKMKPTMMKKMPKIMTGRQAFMNSKKEENMTTQTMAMLWKRLPMESRNQWEKKGEPMKKAGKMICLNLKSQEESMKEEEGVFGFLQKTMKEPMMMM